MKRLIISLTIIILSCTFFSCEKEVSDQKPNRNLAGSVEFQANVMDAEGMFDSKAIGTIEHHKSLFNVHRKSDTVISFRCEYMFSGEGGKVTIISVPEIPLTGKIFDVTFNHTSSNVTVFHRNVEYTSVITSINGWIKDIDHTNKVHAQNSYRTKDSYSLPFYDYQIDITCVLDGKILNIKTTKDEQKFPSDN